MATKVILPQMGEGVIEATITKWLVKEGDQVSEYDPLVEVNTDKVDTEVPSPAAGTVLKVLPAEGDVVPVESVLVWIGKPGEELPEGADDIAPAAAPTKQAAQPEPAQPVPTPAPIVQPANTQPTPSPAPRPIAGPAPSNGGGLAAAISPLAAKVAAEHGVDLAQVPGSGVDGRITKGDVLDYVRSGGAARAASAPMEASNGPAGVSQPVIPKYDGQNMATFASPVVKRLAAEHNLDVTRIQGSGQGGRVTKQDIEAVMASGQVRLAVVPAPAAKPAFPAAFPDAIPGQVMKLNPLRKSIAEHMKRSKATSPHVTTIMEADMSAVAAHRAASKPAFAQQSVNLTYTAYLLSSLVAACQAYPIVNSSWTDEGIAVHGAINIGVATALEPDGLIVPVVKHAGAMSLLELARSINDLSGRARAKQLKPDEVQGGTITITNHGTSGSLFATPIINQPQCAILGVGVIEKRVKVIDDAIAIRPMVYLGLTFDHRILDGAVADYFLGTVKYTLENWA